MLEQLAAPVVFPVSLATAKDWLRETTADWDAVIRILIRAAVERVETVTHRSLVYRPVRERFDALRWFLELSAYPVLGIKSFNYIDTAGAQQTLSPTLYRLDVTKSAARITPEYAQYFPPVRPVMNAVSITYDVGALVPIVSVDTVADTINAPGANRAIGDIVQLSGDAGTVPGGLNPGQIYYALDAGDVFRVSATSGGAAVDLTSAGAAPIFIGTLPAEMLLAMQLMMWDWFQNPGAITALSMREMPAHGAAEALLTPFMVRGF